MAGAEAGDAAAAARARDGDCRTNGDDPRARSVMLPAAVMALAVERPVMDGSVNIPLPAIVGVDEDAAAAAAAAVAAVADCARLRSPFPPMLPALAAADN